MAVRVRMFAAARAAAGTGEVDVPPGTVAEVLTGLESRFGARFASVLEVATVLVDGSTVDRHAGAPVPDGAEVAILPPFSGGCGGSGGRAP